MLTRADVEVAVIGAGPAGLATAMALATADTSITERMVVIDPAGSWLAGWNDRMARQRVRHLRSPITHHPHPDPFALQRHCRREGFSDVVRDGRRLPSTEGFRDFAEAIIDEYGLSRVEADSVTELATTTKGVEVNLGSGRELACRRLVLAIGNGPPHVPDGLPDDPRLKHAEAVDLRDLPPAGTRVLVVGGGLTAAHLAIGAATSGLRVMLALRGAPRVRRFDVAPGWMGPKYLDGFNAERDRIQRRATIAGARDGGTIPPWARRSLGRLEHEGALELLQECPLISMEPQPSGIQVRLGEAEREVDQVWMATGFCQDVYANPLLRQLADRHPIPIHEGIPDLDADLGWGGTPVHVLGAPGALMLGPTAGNLHGQRRGAHRIAKAVVPQFEPTGLVAHHLD